MKLQLSGLFLTKMGALLASLVGLTLIAILAGQDYTEPIAIIGTLILAVFALGLLWSVYKYKHTVLSEAGVRQATLRGSLFIPWNEVRALRLYGGAYILDSPLGQVIINPKAYEQQAQVANYVTSHLRKLMEARSAKDGQFWRL